MEHLSTRRRQVDLFNFSFLDILACVIGLLIFILTVVVISGGGPSLARKQYRLASAEHRLHDAQVAAQLAGERRARTEALLHGRAMEALAPQAAAESIRAQTSVLKAEADSLRLAISGLRTRRSSTDAEIDRLSAQRAIDTKIAELDRRTHRIEEQASNTMREAQKIHESKVTRKEVQYHIPHLRPTQRRPLFVEVSGDRMWCLASADYEQTHLNLLSTRYDRRQNALGVEVFAVTAGLVQPQPIAASAPEGVVITIAVRPDGFAAFRHLRQWAWSKGFSVNWVLLETDEPIVLTKTNSVSEQ